MTNYVSFDIGTCTTVCAVLEDVSEDMDIPARVVNIDGNSPFCPSYVAIKDDKFLIGSDAMNLSYSSDYSVFTQMKRDLGIGKVYRIGNDNYDPAAFQATIARRIFRKVLNQNGWDESSTKVTFTIPIDFSPKAKNAYIKALKAKKFDIDSGMIFNEPLSALMAVAHEKGSEIDGKDVMIVDIGGGTTDVIVAHCLSDQDGFRIKPRGYGGKKDIGGADFDKYVRNIILDSIFRKYPDIVRENFIADRKNMFGINRLTERVKIDLCENRSDQTFVHKVFGKDDPVVGRVSWEGFKEASKPLVDRIVDECGNALSLAINDDESNLRALDLDPIGSADDIDLVVFIGGGSKAPMIKDEFLKRYPNLSDRVIESVDPQKAVALGAAYLARSVDRFRSLNDPATSVAPVTDRAWTGIGVEVTDYKEGHRFSSVHIWKNDLLPTELRRKYLVPENHTAMLKSDIYSIPGWTRDKGKRCELNACEIIGTIKLDASAAKDNDVIDVLITLDHNGTIKVVAELNGKETAAVFNIQR